MATKTRPILLAPPTGADEAALDGMTGLDAALRLLGRLARQADGSPVACNSLAISDADRLIAAICMGLYGSQVECRVSCRGCGEPYEFSLDLAALIATQDAERPGPADGDGCWPLPDGRRVRAPRISDLGEAASPEALLARLVTQSEADADPQAPAALLERVAPLLTLDLDAACPACARAETVRFDIARYLAARLAGERPFLIREVHLIAARYGWALADIMALSRADRRAYAGLIESERSAGQRALRRA